MHPRCQGRLPSSNARLRCLVQHLGDEWRVAIPDAYRASHEAHFAQVTKQFLSYLKDVNSFPAWEKPNMLAKYFVTTQGVHKSRQATI